MITANNKGFTLTELIVVIAIFAIGMAIVLPNLKDMGQRNQVKTEARQLKDQLARARATAIEQNSAIQVSLTANNYTVNGTTTALRNGTAINTNPGGTLKFPATISWDSRGYPTMKKADNTEITDMGTIIISGDDASYKIIITVAGSITID